MRVSNEEVWPAEAHGHIELRIPGDTPAELPLYRTHRLDYRLQFSFAQRFRSATPVGRTSRAQARIVTDGRVGSCGWFGFYRDMLMSEAARKSKAAGQRRNTAYKRIFLPNGSIAGGSSSGRKNHLLA
jgi:hypothetical protein